MATSQIPTKHREGSPSSPDHGPTGLVPGTDRRREANPKRKPRPRRSYNRGNKKPSNAGPRYRASDTPAETTLLGVQRLVDSNGISVVNNAEDHLSYPLIKRIWDESHKLERPVLGTYRKGIYDRLHRIYGKPVHNSGGPLRIIQCSNPLGEIQGIGSYHGRDFREFGGYLENYIGGFVPANWNHGFSLVDFNSAGFSGPLGSDYEPAVAYGAEVYNKIKPRIADFDVMQGLGQNMLELPSQLKTTSRAFSNAYEAISGRKASGIGRDVLRKAFGGRGSRKEALKRLLMPKELADQFLNEQFGWAPFVGDALDLWRAYNRQEKRFAEIFAQNNTWNHRTRTLFNIEEESEPVVIDNFAGNCYPVLTDQYYRSSGTWVTSKLYTVTKRKVWGSGSFKFYAPEFDPSNRASEGMYGDVMRLLHYYGARVSPTVVWELTPWTWLVDWGTNTGKVLDNITSTVFDRLVSKYAYVMCLSNFFVFNDTTIHLKGGDVHCVWNQHVVSKRREAAHPYGFGLLDGNLSARQTMILAALGLSRRP